MAPAVIVPPTMGSPEIGANIPCPLSLIVLPAGLTSISPSSKRKVSILVRVSFPSVPEIVIVSNKPETDVEIV